MGTLILSCSDRLLMGSFLVPKNASSLFVCVLHVPDRDNSTIVSLGSLLDLEARLEKNVSHLSKAILEAALGEF